jgi:NAD+ synthase
VSKVQELQHKLVNGQNYAKISKKTERFISDYVSKNSAKGLVIGLSGGLDSSVVLKLSANALGSQNVLGLVMPTNVTPREDIKHAIELAGALKVEYKMIDLDPIIEKYASILPDDKKARGNLMARIRMSILYYHAFLRRYLVAGTGDKSEYYIGFFTKYGDGGADIMPILHLYKSQVRALAWHLGILNAIIEKKSSPRLWANHLAEEEIGMNYEIIDSILHLMVDKKVKPTEITRKLNVPREQIDKVRGMVEKSVHKRMMAENIMMMQEPYKINMNFLTTRKADVTFDRRNKRHRPRVN